MLRNHINNYRQQSTFLGSLKFKWRNASFKQISGIKSLIAVASLICLFCIIGFVNIINQSPTTNDSQRTLQMQTPLEAFLKGRETLQSAPMIFQGRDYEACLQAACVFAETYRADPNKTLIPRDDVDYQQTMTEFGSKSISHKKITEFAEARASIMNDPAGHKGGKFVRSLILRLSKLYEDMARGFRIPFTHSDPLFQMFFSDKEYLLHKDHDGGKLPRASRSSSAPPLRTPQILA